MNEQASVMSTQNIVQKYGVDGIGKGADKWMIRRQMLEQFRKEIFDLSVFRIGPQVFSDSYTPTKKEQEKLENILSNENKKWRAVCRIFSQYRETSGLLDENDLAKYLNEQLTHMKVGEDDNDISEENDEEETQNEDE